VLLTAQPAATALGLLLRRCGALRGRVFQLALAPGGPTSDPTLALRVWLLYAGVLAIGIVTDYTVLSRYLRLFRYER
jgi:hypothetical protein